MALKPICFRLPEQTIKELKEVSAFMAENEGCNVPMTRAMTRLVKGYHDAYIKGEIIRRVEERQAERQ